MSQLKKSLLTLGAAAAVGSLVAATALPAQAMSHNPCKPKANPCGANPCKPNPCGANPCKAKANPCGANPCKPNPCGANPCKAKANPCGANPCKPNPCGANPCKAKANPCGANPCKAKANPCGANPCKAKANPCGPCGANPCKAKANPCGPCGANPCKAKANPCGPCGANPCGPCGAKKKAVTLTDKQAAAIYKALAKKLHKGYAKSGNSIAKVYWKLKKYNTAPYQSDTHGGRYVNNFANGKARDYIKYQGDRVLPAGAVVIKDSFQATGANSGAPGPLFVMEKMRKGWNKASLDWRYTLIMPTGAVVGTTKGKGGKTVEFCVTCHKAAGKSQLFFLPDKYKVKR
jgi:hypothetical protein